MICFILPEPPSANRWWRKTNKGKVYISPEVLQYKQLVALVCKKQLIDGPVSISIEWCRRIKSGDLDKRIGVLLDGLQGVAYTNDAQIIEIHARRYDTCDFLKKGEIRVLVKSANAELQTPDNQPGASNGQKPRKTGRVGKGRPEHIFKGIG